MMGAQPPANTHLLDELARLAAKNVVHDACAGIKVMQTRQQRTHARSSVRWVQGGHLLIRQSGQLLKKLDQVASHIGVGAIPHVQIGHLRGGGAGGGKARREAGWQGEAGARMSRACMTLGA